eukprot:521590-Rhodomonas_salina.1
MIPPSILCPASKTGCDKKQITVSRTSEATHLVGVHLEGARDVVHVALARHDALRAAEAAEGRVRGQVGAAHAAGHAHIGHEVCVLNVEHCALEDGAREIEGAASVGEESGVDGHDLSVLVEADLQARRLCC